MSEFGKSKPFYASRFANKSGGSCFKGFSPGSTPPPTDEFWSEERMQIRWIADMQVSNTKTENSF